MCNQPKEIIKGLIQDGYDVNYTAKENNRIDSQLTALYIAAKYGNLEVAEPLFAADADPNQPDLKGFTPLMIAAYYGQLTIVEALLLQPNIKAKQTNSDDRTALFLAAQKGHVAIVEALLKADATVIDEKANDDTPLCIAAELGHLAVVNILIEYGANINANLSRKPSSSPFYLAIKEDHDLIVQALLKAGANVNDSFVLAYKLPPLYLAILNKSLKAAKVLLKNGADLTYDCQHSILSLAIDKKTISMVLLILKFTKNISTTDFSNLEKLAKKSKNSELQSVIEYKKFIDFIQTEKNSCLQMLIY